MRTMQDLNIIAQIALTLKWETSLSFTTAALFLYLSSKADTEWQF